MMLWLRRSPWMWLAVAVAAFLLGLAVQPDRATLADNHRDGFQNRVLEVTASGAGLNVRAQPGQSAAVIDTLYWGDRILWTGRSSDAEGFRWLKVGLGSGQTGWVVDNDGWLIEMDPIYTTPGMGLNAVVQITQMGDESHCRAVPSAESVEAQTMQAGDQALVIGGPYQAEYWVWWQYELANGYQCWIVDIPGWFNVSTAGTF
ncbi:MAG TPA: SH3 domain-containing protein [Aggregatilinea sp.]|uniref:SH3 domain-containing protein n=1 Tax=Aggregatilinea sp. TaxID=2806333 RepID=UPI002CE3E5A8|nr:SH3 domain-containing protein [Aggregatilinea sp.]HML21737.1 SH3 domain-containing protein [Aggregatilinea sp.]